MNTLAVPENSRRNRKDPYNIGCATENSGGINSGETKETKEKKPTQESSPQSDLLKEMIFTNEALVIPTSVKAFDPITNSENAFNIELKNIFSIIENDVGGVKMIRIFALLKLPKELFPDGYKNAYGEIERWFPIYRSSGKNSGHKGRWHPFLGMIVNPIIHPSRSPMNRLLQGFIDFALKEKKKLPEHDGGLESKDKEWMENVKINNLHLHSWLMKCKYLDLLPQPRSLSENLNDEEKKKLTKRFKNMAQTLVSKDAIPIWKLKYKHPSPEEILQSNNTYIPAPESYLCNNFFNLVNDTLNNTEIIKFDETKEQIQIVKSNKTFIINNIMNDSPSGLINKSLGKQNIFGMNLNRQSPDPEIVNIINIINKYKELFHKYLNESEEEESVDNLIKIFLEVLTNRQNLYTIDEIFEKLTSDHKFITTIRGSERTKSVINKGGRRKSRRRNKRKTKIKKKLNKRRRKSRKRIF